MKDIRKKIHESLLSESVEETLNRIGIITEMTVPLKDYKRRVDGLRFQLVENWCLCKYCQLYDKTSNNYNHWLSELKACIDNLKLLDIKGTSDKRKTLIKMLVNDYDYDKVNMILRIIAGKFNREKINDEKQIISVAKSFSDNIESLIDAISIDTIITDKYLKDTFELEE